MSLINLNPMARPGSSTEVTERLCAIAGLEMDPRLFLPQTYFTTPTMQGRDGEILRVRKQMIRALRKRGGAMIIEGASGVGRTRFLYACVLEGKILGAVVLKADASDGYAGDWGVVRALLTHLVEALPENELVALNPRLSTLEELLSTEPEGVGNDAPSAALYAPTKARALASFSNRPRAGSSSHPSPNPEGSRSRIETELRELLLQVSSMLIVQSSCVGGLLYLVQREGPVLHAKHGDHPPPLEIEKRVIDYLSTELSDSEEVTTTETDIQSAAGNEGRWISREGKELCPILIGHHTEKGYAITAIAVMSLDPNRELKYPGDVIGAVSETLLARGDVNRVFAAD